MNFLLEVIASFIGSLLAIAFWFHWDVEDHWRLWKVRRGKRMEERSRSRDIESVRIHEVCLDEMRRDGCLL